MHIPLKNIGVSVSKIKKIIKIAYAAESAAEQIFLYNKVLDHI